MNNTEEQTRNIFEEINHDDWLLVKFGNIAFNISERVEPGDSISQIYVGLDHLDSNSLHIRRTGTPADVKGTKLKVYKGDIIFGKRRAYQRKAAIANFDGICSAHAMVLCANQEAVDPNFFPFLIHSNAFMEKAVEISEGSLSPTIKWKKLKEQSFRLPPLPIQKKLAELLWAIDDVEQSHKTSAIKLYQTKLSLIDDMVVRGFSTKSFKQSPLGLIPDTWRVVRLGDFAESIQYGFTASATRKMLGPKFLRITDIQENHVNWGDVPYCVCSQVDKYKLATGDIVFARTGATTGKSYHIKEPPEAVFASYLIRVRTSEAFDSEYVHAFFQSSFYWKQISTQTIGSAQGGFNASKLSDLLITLPPIEDQRRIVKEVAKFDHVINLANSAGESDLSLRQAVLSIL